MSIRRRKNRSPRQRNLRNRCALARERHEAQSHIDLCDAEIRVDSAISQCGNAVLGASKVVMHVEVKCRKERKLHESLRIAYIDAGLDEVEHGCDSVGEVVAKANAVREAGILFSVLDIV